MLGDAPGKMLLKEVVVSLKEVLFSPLLLSQFIIGHWGIIGFYGGGSCFLGGKLRCKRAYKWLDQCLNKNNAFSSSSLGAINDHDIKPKKATQAW